MFYRVNDNGNADIFENDGTKATKINANVYPIDSELSAKYEHVNGITLTIDDAKKIGIEEE